MDFSDNLIVKALGKINERAFIVLQYHLTDSRAHGFGNVDIAAVSTFIVAPVLLIIAFLVEPYVSFGNLVADRSVIQTTSTTFIFGALFSIALAFYLNLRISGGIIKLHDTVGARDDSYWGKSFRSTRFWVFSGYSVWFMIFFATGTWH